MKKFRQGKKGFTLIELMIVIVIIGILAAILIPTISNGIQKARIASDQSDLRNMNMLFEVYKTNHQITGDLDIHGLYEAVVEEAGYPMTASAKGYSYWYNRETNRLEYGKTDEMIIGNNSSFIQRTYAAGSSVYPDEPEAISNRRELLYVDQGDDELATFFYTIRNITTFDVYNTNETFYKVYNDLNDDFFDDLGIPGEQTRIKALLEEYQPGSTLYISDKGMFNPYNTNAANASMSNTYGTISHIVFCYGIKYVMGNNLDITYVVKDGSNYVTPKIYLPSTVRYVSAGAFSGFQSSNQIVLNTRNNTIFATGSLSTELAAANSGIGTVSVPSASYTAAYNQYDVYAVGTGNAFNAIPTRASITATGITENPSNTYADCNTYQRKYKVFSPIVINPNGKAEQVSVAMSLDGYCVYYSATMFDEFGNISAMLGNVGYFTDINVLTYDETLTDANKLTLQKTYLRPYSTPTYTKEQKLAIYIPVEKLDNYRGNLSVMVDNTAMVVVENTGNTIFASDTALTAGTHTITIKCGDVEIFSKNIVVTAVS
ncbi:MAG: prepilin-type N-terminal cleavage/methylation domain-containing protein [Clostridia bacterium]|nr:prepilin-type N-terminal cleavage/methylation domain-containing protein [Clostridia bacterium]